MRNDLITVMAISLFLWPACLPKREKSKELKASGKLRLGGSTTVFPLARAASKAFMERHAGTSFSLAQSSSEQGLKQFIAGQTDILTATPCPG